MNKLIFTQVGFMSDLEFYLDFSDRNNVEVEVSGHNIKQGVIDKKYTLDKKLSNKVFDALDEYNCCLERDYQKDVLMMDGVNTDMFLMRDIRIETSHWYSFAYPEYKDVKELYEAMILACPEVKNLLIGGEV